MKRYKKAAVFLPLNMLSVEIEKRSRRKLVSNPL